MKALEVRELSKSFGNLQVLDNISFSVDPGERMGIIGPNGAGKSTLFNILSGLLKPTRGEIYIGGRDATGLDAYERARLGLARTFQKNNLFPGLSLAENLKLAARDPASQINVSDYLEITGLYTKMETLVRDLSYGDQRQVDMLLALVQCPRILLLDEPTAGMSSVETRMTEELISSLPKEITIIIVEHDMDVVFNLADRLLVLFAGAVLCQGDKEKVRSDKNVKEAYLGNIFKEKHHAGIM